MNVDELERQFKKRLEEIGIGTTKLSKKSRIIVLERRIKHLGKKLETLNYSKTQKSYIINELIALEWALTLLYDCMYPEVEEVTF